MIVYFTIGFYVLFLLLQEKNQKKQAKGALTVRLKFDAFEDGWAEIGTFPPGLLKTMGLACFGGGYTRGASL